jgi:DNA-binding transcriptional regulator GbsR (MarR family)
MNDTPETDAFFAEWTRTDGVLARSRLFAEKLERERDEARDMVEKFTEQGLDLMDANRMLKRERDEAREKLEEEMKWHHRTHQELVEAQCKLLDIEHDKLKS